MTTSVAIVVALVVLAVVVFVTLSRGKGGSQLQAPPAARPLPSTRPPPPARRPSDRPQEREAEGKPAPAPPAAEARGESTRPAAAAPSAAPEARPPSAAQPGSSIAPAKRDVAGLRKGLAASRGGFVAKLSALFQGKKEIDPAILQQVEEVMLASDVGPKTTQTILARLRESLERNELHDADAVWASLRAEAVRILGIGGGPVRLDVKPTVVLMVGVNGVGKTTTIGKLATRYKAAGKKVVLAAGDTFRAAAVQQLEIWGKRVESEVVRGKEGADPGAVAFDATSRAKDGGADILFIDTAGRLHTKAPLMDEIKKVRKTIAKAMDGAPHETFLVLDATTGQNALQQASLFKEALDLTGIILTKLDGTAKGGIVLGICDELGVPVRYVGLGERAEDLREFHAEEFVEALFGKGEDEVAAA
ncbi:MAG TPA: signal recognition particle-docking protein FtsY [Polyangiaceae bacterium]|jgi:fused signal recognition particle receptor|nr:signal recognition particle-docking protein FtsY [Polyangiaceae bacterium]